MSHPNPLRVVLRAAPRSSNSALTTVLSRATLGPVTEAPGVLSRVAKDMLRPVGSGTFLSRSDTAILRNRGRRVVDVDGGVQSTVFMRLKSLNRRCPCNWSTTSYVPAGMPSLSAQLRRDMEVHRWSSAPPSEVVWSRMRYRGGIFTQNGGHHVKEHPRLTLG